MLIIYHSTTGDLKCLILKLKNKFSSQAKDNSILKSHQSGERIFSEGFDYFRSKHCMNSLLRVLISIYGPLDAGSCPSDKGSNPVVV